jgi:hypothetical protein
MQTLLRKRKQELESASRGHGSTTVPAEAGPTLEIVNKKDKRIKK